MGFIHVFRLFFPSWRFFESYGNQPELQVRVASSEKTLEVEPWKRLLPKIKRKPWHIVFNPYGNILLAQQSLVEQIVHEIGELNTKTLKGFPQTNSYALLERLVLFYVRNPSSSGIFYQFKITYLESSQEEPILISPIGFFKDQKLKEGMEK